MIFQSWGPPTGLLNRQKVTTPYPSKDHLQDIMLKIWKQLIYLDRCVCVCVCVCVCRAKSMSYLLAVLGGNSRFICWLTWLVQQFLNLLVSVCVCFCVCVSMCVCVWCRPSLSLQTYMYMYAAYGYSKPNLWIIHFSYLCLASHIVKQRSVRMAISTLPHISLQRESF